MRQLKLVFLSILLSFFQFSVVAQSFDRGQQKQTAVALIHHVLSENAASHFQVKMILSNDGENVVEVESEGNKVILWRNNRVLVTYALNWHFKCYTH